MSDLTSLANDIRQGIAKLEMISHAPTQNFDPTPRDTADEPGGRRPQGTDMDRPPRSASNLEKIAWLDSYQAKTVRYFRRECEHALRRGLERGDREHAIARLSALRDDLYSVISLWRQLRIPDGQPPALGDAGWKRYVASCGRSTSELSREYMVSSQYINRVKAMDWSAPVERWAA